MKIMLTIVILLMLLMAFLGCSWTKTLGQRMCPCCEYPKLDTSKCFIMIVNPKNGKYNYYNAYEVDRFISDSAGWETIKYLYEDRKTVIKETKRRKIIYIESQM